MPVLGLERDASVKITTCCVSLVTRIQILRTRSSSTESVGPISDPNTTFSSIYLHSWTCTQTFKNIFRTPASSTRSLAFFPPLAFRRQSHLAQGDRLTIYVRIILNCWSSCLCVPEYWDYSLHRHTCYVKSLIKDLTGLASLLFLYILGSTTCLGMAPPIEGEPSYHQSIWLRLFLRWGPFFPDDSSFCQTDKT